jgi:sugar lactone lactonase YvrE
VVSDGSHVYLANGQVLIYGLNGKQVGQIDVPDRPIQLALGGANKKTLFILTHHALYRAQL